MQSFWDKENNAYAEQSRTYSVYWEASSNSVCQRRASRTRDCNISASIAKGARAAKQRIEPMTRGAVPFNLKPLVIDALLVPAHPHR